ncbi:MAG: response regulator transcription factor [Acidimicrobiia bacterium]|nr:response regulator transcription factor [Acidimicrobiia bacterium]MBT8193242.1 response regulator transcription factor [Acidimicrobiia bacterium]MBT8246444.1 response regulator transcription factor [Acidimicrobiia bacterium]NNF87246.1 response regulator transcription factor [Acidimicrobiia bacterium]NNJ46482.1 response regulator transcription factor [Acidimicrobiia bacterium]
MKKILVVEDELKIARLVRDYLHQAGFAVIEASDGASALSLARSEKPDMVVLDLGLPEMDGLDVTRRLRQSSSVPIIMLTARSEESDRIVGLELGADDYIVKPFSPKELVARIRAVLRRADATLGGGELIRAGAVTIDLPKMRVTVGDAEADLTATEFELLVTLARHPGRIYTRAQLLDALHGVSFESYERSVDAHIKNLRRKIEADPRRPQLLLTVYGVGYKFSDA